MKKLIMGLSMAVSNVAFAGDIIECVSEAVESQCFIDYNYLKLDFENKKVLDHSHITNMSPTPCAWLPPAYSYLPQKDVDIVFSAAKNLYLLGRYEEGHNGPRSVFIHYAELNLDFPEAKLSFVNENISDQKFMCKII